MPKQPPPPPSMTSSSEGNEGSFAAEEEEGRGAARSLRRSTVGQGWRSTVDGQGWRSSINNCSPAEAALSKYSLIASTISARSRYRTTTVISPPAEDPALSDLSDLLFVEYFDAAAGGFRGCDYVRNEDLKFDFVPITDLESLSLSLSPSTFGRGGACCIVMVVPISVMHLLSLPLFIDVEQAIFVVLNRVNRKG
ncbi:hypothetical protein Vadar_000273 [Vaccinium darrowii]|nr:hypothetical protein Vadar_000273 [Vaccinium darrowii]